MAKKPIKAKAKKTPGAKRPVGRPPAYSNPEDMQRAVDAYFSKCDVDGRPYTVCGLSLGLGFNGRQSMFDYEAKQDFTDIIKKARARVEQRLEERLNENGCTGAIFNLKCNFGYVEPNRLEVTGEGGGPLKIEFSTVYEKPLEMLANVIENDDGKT